MATRKTPPKKTPPPPTKAARGRTAPGRSVKNEPQADPSLQAIVQKMDLSHVQCRDFGHSWRPYSARWIPQDNCYRSELECQRCHTVRTRFLSRTGEQLSSAYDYVEGYQVHGMGRLTGHDRDIIRLQSILSVLPNDTIEE